MLLGLPDNIHEEKPSFLQLKKTRYGRTDGRTDRRTDGRTDRPSYRDARTHLKRLRIDTTGLTLSTLGRLLVSLIIMNKGSRQYLQQ